MLVYLNSLVLLAGRESSRLMSGVLFSKRGAALVASHGIGLDLFGFQAIPLVLPQPNCGVF